MPRTPSPPPRQPRSSTGRDAARSGPPRGAKPPREAKGERVPQAAARPSGFGPRPLQGKPHRQKPPGAAREENAPAPPGKGRDRRGTGERPPRQIETPPPVREPRPSPAAIARDAPPANTLWLHGIHAVAAALANPRRRFKRLLLTVDAEAALIQALPKPWPIPAERVERNRFQTFLSEDAVHQGAALLAEPLAAVPLEEALAASNGPVLLLDQVTDPRNVGAILRSAAAFGAACVVMQDRNAAPETGALARAASGALELVPIAREVNLSRAIVALQKAGFWVLGLAGEGKRTLAEAVPRDRRTALVLGAEDTGMRRLQRETCDELVRLPMAAGVESLNVAAAAAVALYEIARMPAEAPEDHP